MLQHYHDLLQVQHCTTLDYLPVHCVTVSSVCPKLLQALISHVVPSAITAVIFPCLLACFASLIQFFNKMRKWSDMANLNQEFRDKVDRLERNFAVSTVIFKKFQPIFLDIFRDPTMDMPRQQRNKKQRQGGLLGGVWLKNDQGVGRRGRGWDATVHFQMQSVFSFRISCFSWLMICCLSSLFV